MSYTKRITAGVLGIALTASITACGESTTWGAKINDKELRAGIYINYAMDSYYNALDKLEEGQKDVLTATIDGKSGKQWIKDNATLSMQKYVAVEEKFDELGLELIDEDISSVKNFTDQMWQYYSSVYEENGISKESYYDISMNGLKKSYIFEYYYDTDGTEEVSKQEIEDYMSENYAYINSIKMVLKDGEGNLLKSDGKAKIEEMANDYIERAKNGEDFNKIAAEYNKYYSDLVAEAQKKAAEEAQTAETTVSETEGTIKVEESTAGTEDTEETADAEKAEETVADNSTVVKKGSESPSKTVNEKLFDGSLKIGDVVLIKEDEAYYVVMLMDILKKEGYYDSEKKSILHELKDEEFDNLIESWTEGQNVVINEKAYKRYDPEMFTTKETESK